MASSRQREWEQQQALVDRKAIHAELVTIRQTLSDQHMTAWEPAEIIVRDDDGDMEEAIAGMNDLLGNIDEALSDVTHAMRSGLADVCRGQQLIAGGLGTMHGELALQRQQLQSLNEGVWGLYDLVDEVGLRLGDRIDNLAEDVRAQTDEIVGALQELDQNAQERHEELLKAIRSPLNNAAEERYAEAMRQLEAGYVGSALAAIRKGLDANGAHAHLWMLFARCCYRRTRHAAALGALERCARYAAIDLEKELYEAAVLRSSRLLRALGRVDEARATVQAGIEEAPIEWSMRLYELRFEAAKYAWEFAFKTSGRERGDTLYHFIWEAVACLKKMPAPFAQLHGGAFGPDVFSLFPSIKYFDKPFASLGHCLAILRLADEVLPGFPFVASGPIDQAMLAYRNVLEEFLQYRRFGKDLWAGSPIWNLMQETERLMMAAHHYCSLKEKGVAINDITPPGTWPLAEMKWFGYRGNDGIVVYTAQLSEEYGSVIACIAEGYLFSKEWSCAQAQTYLAERCAQWQQMTQHEPACISGRVKKYQHDLAWCAANGMAWPDAVTKYRYAYRLF